jgi:hypothetical protein
VFTGPCSACNGSIMDVWQQACAAVPGVPVAIVTRDSARNVQQFLAKRHYGFAFHADPDGQCATRYNALWTPRVYTLGAGRRLTWREGIQTLSPQLILARLAPVAAGAKR